jgi:hypothetical protein
MDVQLQVLLSLVLDREWSASNSGRFSTRNKSRYALTRKVGAGRAGLDTVDMGSHPLLLPGIELRFFGHQARNRLNTN